MSLQFIFGGSGSGKSTYVQNMLIKEAKANTDKQYLLIVPDQFTMQTQKQMVTRHEDGGIINIDVLSFSRLSHRIFAEVGSPEYTMLDDTGKCLIIRKIAAKLKDELSTLNKGMNNPGWAENVKAALSEFMQYGIKEEDIQRMIDNTSKASLRNKLADLALIYKAFIEECGTKYATKETILDVLCERIELSKVINNSIVCFDGFTGFTPVQVNVIEAIMQKASELIVTLSISPEYEPYNTNDEEGLFYLSQKTVYTLQRCAQDNNISLADDIWLKDNYRHTHSKELLFLEKNLFREDALTYESEPEDIKVIETVDIENECHVVASEIFNLIKTKNYRYRDIAIVTGDLESYERPLARAFTDYSVPYHMDLNREVMTNPLIMFMRLTMQVLERGYRRDDMINLLRTGLVSDVLSEDDVDALENYCLARNIKGRSAWVKDFTKHTYIYQPVKEGEEDPLNYINSLRKKCVAIFDPFYTKESLSKRTVVEWLTCFYNFLDALDIEKKLLTEAERFDSAGDSIKASEYRQIFPAVMGLFDQVAGLLSDEEVKLSEFADVLEAGYKELRVGIIPQMIDQITVGDITRSRLGEIKALFFMGVNDGKIPKVNKKGGILSVMDKEYIAKELNVELSPSTKEQIFSEKLYMYLNVTKPSEKLYLSYSTKDSQSKAMFPAYFIATMQDMFVELGKTNYNIQPLSINDLKKEAGILLGKYAHTNLTDTEEALLRQRLGELWAADEKEFVEKAINRAFFDYKHKQVSKEATDGLFKNENGDYVCSVSSLEEFAGCQFKHFLDYGIRLSEREIFSVESNDRGNVFHDIMQNVLKNFKEEGKDILSLSDDEIICMVDKVVAEETDSYNEGIFNDNSITEYYKKQVQRIARFNIKAIVTQLKRGKYVPEYFEKKIGKEYFVMVNDEEIRVCFTGRVDRTDLYVDDENKTIYVKITDYKSGNKTLDMDMIEKGAQLQLPLYLKVLKEELAGKEDYEIVPAAGIYYRIKDDISDEDNKSADEHMINRISAMCGNGIFNTDNTQSFDNLFGTTDSLKPKVLPVNGRSPAVFASSSVSCSMDEINDYITRVEDIALDSVKKVLEGNISMKPLYVDSKYDACEYCNFKSICGFDEKLEGFERNEE